MQFSDLSEILFSNSFKIYHFSLDFCNDFLLHFFVINSKSAAKIVLSS